MPDRPLTGNARWATIAGVSVEPVGLSLPRESMSWVNVTNCSAAIVPGRTGGAPSSAPSLLLGRRDRGRR